MVRLLHVAVLVGDPGVVRRRHHPVVREQRGVAVGGLHPPVGVEPADGRAEVVGAVLLRYAAELPQRGLDPFRQRLEALRQADMDGFHIGVGQHEMEDEVREEDAGDGEAQVGHVGEVGLRPLAGPVDLGEDHLPGRAVLRAPRGDVPLQGPQLDRLVAPRVLVAQQGEEGRRLQRRIPLELRLDPGPVVGEGIAPRLVGARRLQLARQVALALILPHGPHAHPGAGGRLLLGLALGTFTLHQYYLRIGLHGLAPSSREAMLLVPRGGPGDRQF